MAGLAPNGEVKTLYKSKSGPGGFRGPFTHFDAVVLVLSKLCITSTTWHVLGMQEFFLTWVWSGHRIHSLHPPMQSQRPSDLYAPLVSYYAAWGNYQRWPPWGHVGPVKTSLHWRSSLPPFRSSCSWECLFFHLHLDSANGKENDTMLGFLFFLYSFSPPQCRER